MLDVTRLRVLVAVARHGSVTAAAHALNYAQPSVSHHLARLEAETGTKLIQRAGRGIRLTDAGRLLAERAAEVIGRLDAAENELAVYSGLRAGRLRLAAFPSALSTLVPAAAARMRDQHPIVDLRLTEAEPPEALRMLRAGYVDVALVFRHEPETVLAQRGLPGQPAPTNQPRPTSQPAPADPDSASPANQPRPTSQASPANQPRPTSQASPASRPQPASRPPGEAESPPTDRDLREDVLLDEPVHVIAPEEAADGDVMPAAAITEMWPADLARFSGQRWIAGCDRCREHLLKQCAAAGFSPKIAFTTDDFVAVQALVTAGLGLAMLPGLCLRASRNPGIRAIRLRGTRRSVVAVRYGEPPDPPATALLLEALKSVAGDCLSRTDNVACPARRLRSGAHWGAGG